MVKFCVVLKSKNNLLFSFQSTHIRLLAHSDLRNYFYFLCTICFLRENYVFSVVLRIHGLPTASYWYHAVLRNKSLFGLEFLDWIK
jgi:hypothetical protein